MPTVPRTGEYVYDQKFFKITSVIYVAKDEVLFTLPNGAICVRVIVQSIKDETHNTIERRAKAAVILLWIFLVIFGVGAIFGPRKNLPVQDQLVPGIGDIFKPKTTPELEDPPPPKPKGIYL